jgi:hypothetical protein
LNDSWTAPRSDFATECLVHTEIPPHAHCELFRKELTFSQHEQILEAPPKNQAQMSIGEDARFSAVFLLRFSKATRPKIVVKSKIVINLNIKGVRIGHKTASSYALRADCLRTFSVMPTRNVSVREKENPKKICVHPHLVVELAHYESPVQMKRNSRSHLAHIIQHH